jgi:hypothetical protein
MPRAKYKVVITRNWHQPEISMLVTDERIELWMDMDDFVRAVVAEVGNPTFMVTGKQLQARLAAAAETVLSGMKRETVKIV